MKKQSPGGRPGLATHNDTRPHRITRTSDVVREADDPFAFMDKARQPVLASEYEPDPDDWSLHPIDPAEFAKEPEPTKFIIDPWIPEGYATGLWGHGGAGKSNVAAHIAICTSSGAEWHGRPVQQRTTVYLSCEDRKPDLLRRGHFICKHLGIEPWSLRRRFIPYDVVGQDMVVWSPQGSRERTEKLFDAYAKIQLIVEHYHAEVIVVDGISDTYAGNENDRAQVKQYVNALLRLIPTHGAVIVLGHVSKSTAKDIDDPEKYSGSTGWHNAVRSRLSLSKHYETHTWEGQDTKVKTGKVAKNDEYVWSGDMILEQHKDNMSGNIGSRIRLRFDKATGMFVPIEYQGGRADREADEENAILQFLADCKQRGDLVNWASRGPGTTYQVWRKDLPESMSAQVFGQRLRSLRGLGLLKLTRYISDARNPKVKIELTAEGEQRARGFRG